MNNTDTLRQGKNCIIGDNVTMGRNITLGHNVVLDNNVVLGDSVFIDSNTIIHEYVTLGGNTVVGCNCVLGEYTVDFYSDRKPKHHPLHIGNNAIIRSGTIIYGDNEIGANFQTGHYASVRENSIIGNNVSAGTLCNIQGDCTIGDYVRLHSNIQIPKKTMIDDYVWMAPNVVITNDPTPPSDEWEGVHICSFAVIATGAIILPGVTVNEDSLVAAGSVVGSDVPANQVVKGNPAVPVLNVRSLRNMKTGERHYPWKYYFSRYMPWEASDFDTWYATLHSTKKCY